MTEYELLDVLNSTVSVLVETFSVYLGATTAYLICAYIVGSRMTRFQCIIISTLYVVSAGVGAFAVFFQASHAADIARQLYALEPNGHFGMQPLAQMALTVACTLGIPACLKFMWDVRHARPD